MKYISILLAILMLMSSITVFDFSNIIQKAYAQNITVNDLVVLRPSGFYTHKPLMSFVEGIYGRTDFSYPGSSTYIYLYLHKVGCSGYSQFNIAVPPTSNTKNIISTSAIYDDHIFLAYAELNTSNYTTTSILYSVSGCTFNLSTTNPTWTTVTNSDLVDETWHAPIWINNRVYLLKTAIYNYDTKTKVPTYSSYTHVDYVRTQDSLIVLTYNYISPYLYIYTCKIRYSDYNSSCYNVPGFNTNSNLNWVAHVYNENQRQIYFNIATNNGHILILYDITNNNYTTLGTSTTPYFNLSYGDSFLLRNKGNYPIYTPLLNSNNTISAIVFYSSNSFKYYKTQADAYNDLKGPIGDLTQNPYFHMLYGASGMTANLFDANFNLIASFTLPSDTNTYNLLRFPFGIKYIQLINTANNQSIIYAKHDQLTNTNFNLNYMFDQYFTTVVMTPITFSRLNTDENYYYVEVVQNKPYKNEFQYYAKFIDQSSQVSIALRQSQCSYLKLHIINKTSLNESIMNFMVCEDGISKTIEIPNTVNFVYANDVIFTLHRYDDFKLGISANRNLNTQTKVTVCSTIDRALFDFENSTLEGVTITPADAQITYVNVTTNEKAMKVYKNASGDYIYEFPLIKIKPVDLSVTVKFIPQNVQNDSVKTYTVNFYVKQYNNSKMPLSNITLINQSGYSGFSTSSYNGYTEYSKTFYKSASTFDPNVEYIQLVLKFTSSTAPYYNHLVSVIINTNAVHRLCHNYALFDSMTANTIYTLEDNVKSVNDKEILILHNNQLYENTYQIYNKSTYSSSSIPALTFENKIKAIFDEFSNKLTGTTTNSITFFLAFMSIMFFSVVITRNIAVMYAIFILIVSITTTIYGTEILSIQALVILAFMTIALAIWYRYR